MHEISENSTLVKHLVGKNLSFKKSISRGLSVGILAFGVFEGISLVNMNVPRIPVPWLLSFVIIIIQIVLFLKISQILRRPRTEDFLFVLGLSYEQRKDVACKSFNAVHRTILPFVISGTVVSVILEMFIVKEKSIINLFVVPVLLLGVNLLLFQIGRMLFRSGVIRVVKRDERNRGFVLFSNESIRKSFSSFVANISSRVSSLAPVTVRPLVKRNIMYLLRSDPFIFPFFTIAAPVFLTLFMLLIGKSSAQFLDFFSVLCVFVLNFYYAGLLQEASVKFKECPYYNFSPKTLFMGHFVTIALLAVPYALIFIGVTNIQLFSLHGVLRLFTYAIALVATLMVNCRAVLHPERKDSDSATDFLFLVIGIGTGIFIPYFGWIFEIATIAAVILLEWESVTNKKLVAPSA